MGQRTEWQIPTVDPAADSDNDRNEPQTRDDSVEAPKWLGRTRDIHSLHRSPHRCQLAEAAGCRAYDHVGLTESPQIGNGIGDCDRRGAIEAAREAFDDRLAEGLTKRFANSLPVGGSESFAGLVETRVGPVVGGEEDRPSTQRHLLPHRIERCIEVADDFRPGRQEVAPTNVNANGRFDESRGACFDEGRDVISRLDRSEDGVSTLEDPAVLVATLDVDQPRDVAATQVIGVSANKVRHELEQTIADPPRLAFEPQLECFAREIGDGEVAVEEFVEAGTTRVTVVRPQHLERSAGCFGEGKAAREHTKSVGQAALRRDNELRLFLHRSDLVIFVAALSTIDH